MAWSQKKTTLLKRLIRERISIESDPRHVLKYQPTRTWMQIIGSHIDEATRQAILNDLIADKEAMMAIDAPDLDAQVQARAALLNQLATSKE